MSVDFNRLMRFFLHGKDVQKPVLYAAAQTDTVHWQPASGKRISLHGVLCSTDGDNDVKLHTDAAGANPIVAPIYLIGKGGFVLPGSVFPYWVGEVDQPLRITSTYAGNHSLYTMGVEID